MQGIPPFPFRGVDVLTWLPDGLLNRAGTWTTPQERMDVPSGAFAVTAPALHPVHTQTARYRCFTRADRITLWTWLSGLLGRYTAFWCPTFQRELEVVHAGTIGAWVIRWCGFTALRAADPTIKYLYGFKQGGAFACTVEITATVDNGDGTETISYRTSVGSFAGNGAFDDVLVTLRSVVAASILRFSRLDTDTLTQTFATPEIVDITFASASITGEQP